MNFFGNGIPQAALLAAWMALAGAVFAQSNGPPSASPSRPAILVLGDSLAAGLGVEPEEAYPALLQRKSQDCGG